MAKVFDILVRKSPAPTSKKENILASAAPSQSAGRTCAPDRKNAGHVCDGKESAKVANQQALQELRGALQTSMVRSCEIVFEHLNRTLDRYHELIGEIESSALSALEKKELLDTLNAKLNVDSLDQKRQSTQQMMESAIWEIRFRKARMMAKKKSDAAISYLKKIRQRTESHKILLQIDALIRELTPST